MNLALVYPPIPCAASCGGFTPTTPARTAADEFGKQVEALYRLKLLGWAGLPAFAGWNQDRFR